MFDASRDSARPRRYFKLSTYAIKTFRSSAGKSTLGMPPTVIFGVGCLRRFSRRSVEYFAPTPTRAGPAAVPTPASPWHALHDCASKIALPFAASGSARATFSAARDADE